MRRFISRVTAITALATLGAFAANAQVTPAAGATPVDDTPTVKIGGVIFADYTYNESPEITDAAGHKVNQSSFNVSRAYLNITGNVTHLFAFRITPDISRETGSGSSLAGSLNFRLKYAYGQLNLDDWTNKGSWVRFGIQQTPWIDFEEGIYRYRFQGTIFIDRLGLVPSSDAGLSGHWVFPSGYGDVHGGFYNGEGYNKAETNNEKAFQIRGSLRPLPLGGDWKGLRLSGYIDSDRPVGGGKRDRALGAVTFEHRVANAAFEVLSAKDQALPTGSTVSGKGWSAWVTPKLPNHFELLLRHDDFKPNKATSQKQTRNIFGVAYWIPVTGSATAAVLVDYDSLKQDNFSPVRPDDTRYGIKLLVSF